MSEKSVPAKLALAPGQVWHTSTGGLAMVDRKLKTVNSWRCYMIGNKAASFVVYHTGRFTRGTVTRRHLVKRAVILYISGPMTGLPESNYPAFNEAAARYRALGNAVVNPVEVCAHLRDKPNVTWLEYMQPCMAALLSCEAVVMLPGWTKSKGARLEHHTARELGFAIVYPTNERE